MPEQPDIDIQDSVPNVNAGLADSMNVLILARPEDLGKSGANVEQLRRSLSETVIGMRTDGRNHNEIFPETTLVKRALRICTRVDYVQKKLLRVIDLVLTLSLAGSQVGQPDPIVWKILHFEKASRTWYIVPWSNRAGICLVEVKENALIDPGAVMTEVTPGIMAILHSENEDTALDIMDQADFDSRNVVFYRQSLEPLFNTDVFALCNKTESEERFVLCLLDENGSKFSPVADLGFIKPYMRDLVVCGSPKMLQAYVISDLQEGQQIDKEKLTQPLFVDVEGKPQPVDLTALGELVFHLYSTRGGRVVLEKEEKPIW